MCSCPTRTNHLSLCKGYNSAIARLRYATLSGEHQGHRFISCALCSHCSVLSHCSYGFLAYPGCCAVMSRTVLLRTVCCLLALHCLSHLTSAVDIPSSVVPRHLAPHFNATAVINSTFTRIALSDYLTEGHWVVLLF